MSISLVNVSIMPLHTKISLTCELSFAGPFWIGVVQVEFYNRIAVKTEFIFCKCRNEMEKEKRAKSKRKSKEFNSQTKWDC